MSKEKIFKELIASMAEDDEISPSEYAILIEKGKDLGLEQRTVDLLIKLELAETSSHRFKDDKENDFVEPDQVEEYVFKSAITRGGSILIPDRIVISDNTVTYKKRNKHLINVDSISIPISKISSVELDTSIWVTDIIIKSFGASEIVGRKFTKSEAKEIKRL
ncbi:MAG: hypothetical protein PHR79_10370, partial [Bacteroidales bacterium]|nr:hypothetical protein [Bacteroidales bacterium]